MLTTSSPAPTLTRMFVAPGQVAEFGSTCTHGDIAVTPALSVTPKSLAVESIVRLLGVPSGAVYCSVEPATVTLDPIAGAAASSPRASTSAGTIPSRALLVRTCESAADPCLQLILPIGCV